MGLGFEKGYLQTLEDVMMKKKKKKDLSIRWEVKKTEAGDYSLIRNSR